MPTKIQQAKGGVSHVPNLQLKRCRLEAGLSQRRLALLAGVSAGVVNLAERGWTPQPENARAILDVLEAASGRPVRYVDIWRQPGQVRVP